MGEGESVVLDGGVHKQQNLSCILALRIVSLSANRNFSFAIALYGETFKLYTVLALILT